mgnify:CR=1 FL=1
MSLHPGTDAWVTHRNLLFTVAYEMLGSAADAEDVGWWSASARPGAAGRCCVHQFFHKDPAKAPAALRSGQGNVRHLRLLK